MLIRRSVLALVGAGWRSTVVRAGLFKKLPDGFLPDEDQGVFFAAVRLPDGASIRPRRTRLRRRSKNVIRRLRACRRITTVRRPGYRHRDQQFQRGDHHRDAETWDERNTPRTTQFEAILGTRAAGLLRRCREAFTFAFGLPPILGSEHRRAASSSCWKIAPAATLPTWRAAADAAA